MDKIFSFYARNNAQNLSLIISYLALAFNGLGSRARSEFVSPEEIAGISLASLS